VLKELVEHHADEEEKSMFKRAKQLMDAAELKALGEKLEARKMALLEQFKAEAQAGA
jgi:hemerythrin superfamily protein